MYRVFILSLLVLIIVAVKLYNLSKTEGFQTYNQCRGLGYSKEFCVQTPTSVFGPAGCMCSDGSMGFVFPGLRGQCLCSSSVGRYLF